MLQLPLRLPQGLLQLSRVGKPSVSHTAVRILQMAIIDLARMNSHESPPMNE